jgi:cytochrome c oxidase subunit 4
MTATEAHAVEEATEHHAHSHPSDAQYVLVALFLAVITGIEVGLYYVDMDFVVYSAILGVLMIVKFATVAAFFMHLRFDNKLFRRIFVTGIILATAVYLVVLFSFHVFSH